MEPNRANRRTTVIMVAVVAALAVLGAAGWSAVQWRTTAGDGGVAVAAPETDEPAPGGGAEIPGASTAPSAPAGPSASASGSPAAGATSAGASPRAPGAGRPPTGGGWPGPGNTGVPAGTKLTPYTGPCTITGANTVIEAKAVTCDLLIKAKGVVIRKSRVVGHVHTDDNGAYSVTIEDTEVDNGRAKLAAVAYNNVTLIRANVHGGQHGVICVLNCTVRDSWLHGQYMPPGADWHLNAFLMNGGKNATLIHNTLACDNPDNGCSAAVGLFGDFSVNSNVLVDNNLFVANETTPYCVYGGSSTSKPYPPDRIVYTNNVFQRGRTGKCGTYGPVTYFDPARPGNVWQNNKWEDGTPLASSN